MEIMRQAMLAADTSELEKLISPSLTYGHTNGMLESYRVFLDDIANGSAKYIELAWTEPSVFIDGDLAIIRHRMISKYLSNGKEGNADIGVLIVWRKDADGIWRVYARQAHNRLVK